MRRRRTPRLLLFPLVGLAAYLLVANAAYWLWVAASAFRGTREPADYPLGAWSVVFAVAPVAGGVLSFGYTRRIRPHDSVQALAWGAAITAMTAVLGIVAAVFQSPF